MECVPRDLGQVLSRPPPQNAQISIAKADLGESIGENCRGFQWECLIYCYRLLGPCENSEPVLTYRFFLSTCRIVNDRSAGIANPGTDNLGFLPLSTIFLVSENGVYRVLDDHLTCFF